MSTVTVEPEVVAPPVETQLLAVVEQTSLAPEAAKSIQTSFAPLFKQAGELLTQSRVIIVTDASQVAQIELSRAFRLQLRKIRIAGENLRKSLQEDAQRRIKALNGFQHILEDLIGSEEARLDQQEKIVERQEAARKEALRVERTKALAPYQLDTSFIALADMPDETFAQLLENTRAAHESKLAAARKAEEGRIRQENERLKEEARIREENARLKREADEREAAAKVERERVAAEKAAADAALAAERQRVAREQAEAAEKARKEREAIEAKARSEREEVERKAKAAAEAVAKKTAAAKKKADDAAAAERARVAEEQRIAAEILAKEKARTKKLEDEAAAKALAELREKEAQEKARRDAELAPERQKILSFAAALVAMDVPKLESEGGQIVQKAIITKLANMAAWLKSEATTL